MRTHLAIQGAVYTAVSANQITSQWDVANVYVVEIPGPMGPGNIGGSHCEYLGLIRVVDSPFDSQFDTGGIGIYPSDERFDSVMVQLCTELWHVKIDVVCLTSRFTESVLSSPMCILETTDDGVLRATPGTGKHYLPLCQSP